MSIRAGYHRIGETVQVTGRFVNAAGAPMAATGAFMRIRDPDGIVTSIPVVPDADGRVFHDVSGNKVGRWNVRLECAGPIATVAETHFHVVRSSVLPPT